MEVSEEVELKEGERINVRMSGGGVVHTVARYNVLIYQCAIRRKEQ